MRYRRVYFFLIAVGVVVSSSGLVGNEPSELVEQPALPAGENQADSVLREITQIRNQLGGSVLKGTILHDATDAGFDTSVRQLSEAKTNDRQRDRPTSSEIVHVVRRQCAELDNVANRIEMLREYHNADQLRNVANELRQLARALDHPAEQADRQTAK